MLNIIITAHTANTIIAVITANSAIEAKTSKKKHKNQYSHFS